MWGLEIWGVRGGERNEKGRSLSVNRILKRWDWFPGDEGRLFKEVSLSSPGIANIKGVGWAQREEPSEAKWRSFKSPGGSFGVNQRFRHLISRFCILAINNIPGWKCDKTWDIFIGKAGVRKGVTE